MSGRDFFEAVAQIKRGAWPAEPGLDVRRHGRVIARLVPVTAADLANADAIARLATWREQGAYWFPAQFSVTREGTRRWLEKGVLDTRDRVLFWVRSADDGQDLGHVGLFRYDAATRTVEIDNIVRGPRGVQSGIMFLSVQTLLGWTFETFDLPAVYLRVFSDNDRAIRLYERCGFRETMRFPLARVEEAESTKWVEVTGEHRGLVSRYYLTMRLHRSDYVAHRAADGRPQ